MAGFFISHEHILKGKDSVLYNKKYYKFIKFERSQSKV